MLFDIKKCLCGFTSFQRGQPYISTTGFDGVFSLHVDEGREYPGILIDFRFSYDERVFSVSLLQMNDFELDNPYEAVDF